MKAVKSSMAGTLESSDIQITIEPMNNQGIVIELKSSVEKQFGKQIRSTITETLEGLKMNGVKVIAIDKGALDCTIKARVQCAAYRAAEIQQGYDWEGIE
ncbi:citrate lyase acyl carrier protein [Clostridium polynesiense]|uniref:citrate lyase acyl carrier protein n=1 Tax=Clostridium polynesiense TaxID=1325933 RepID=UPI00058DD852|nr:citrate lyase acyl carrier protein [Clostridium polynesiense]